MKRSGVLVEFSELALHFQIKTIPSAAGLDQIQEYLYNRSLAREKAELENLKNLFNAFRKVSFLAGNIPEETIDTHDSKVQTPKLTSCFQLNFINCSCSTYKNYVLDYISIRVP